MTALLLLLAATNLITSVVLVRLWRRQRPDAPEPAAEIVAALERQPTAATGTRRIISVEILNPIELAASRGRVVGIAGSFAPGITRRVVYDQAIKTLRQQLVDQHVVADVRLHTLRPPRAAVDQRSDSFLDVVETPAYPPDADPRPSR